MNRSETIAKLAKSLVLFNSEVNKIAKDADNPFFKNNYATLDTIIDEIRPILSKHGLIWKMVLHYVNGVMVNIIVIMVKMLLQRI